MVKVLTDDGTVERWGWSVDRCTLLVADVDGGGDGYGCLLFLFLFYCCYIKMGSRYFFSMVVIGII